MCGLGRFPLLFVVMMAFGIMLACAPNTPAADPKVDPKADPKKDDKLKEPEKIDATTIDGVRLGGLFYPSEKGKNAPVIILCHAIGDATKNGASRKDFGDLPKALQKQGYAVVAFDFRGYGDSKTLASPKDYFLVNPPARPFPAGAKLPNAIDAAKDFKSATALEYAKFGNDLNAVKDYIVVRGNAGDCNHNNVVVLGVEQGAVIGLAWALNEFNRPKELMGRNSEAEDITGFIWVSMRPVLGKHRVEAEAEVWMKVLRDKIPSLIIHGDADKNSDGFWRQGFEIIKPKNEKGYDSTKLVKLKTDVQGAKIFSQEGLDADKAIADYLKANLPARAWKERKGQAPPPSLFAIDKLGLK